MKRECQGIPGTDCIITLQTVVPVPGTSYQYLTPQNQQQQQQRRKEEEMLLMMDKHQTNTQGSEELRWNIAFTFFLEGKK